ncbi:unnamed protein product [Protopolystoma xenopodis]|uniref:Uncharacterized protein n=1 Tax=Protopolystoma xenopodis TaxID=117903 RepID=A0A3S5AXX4_9PLAT|nr:unnamed protein product [Protopolystoma xenopodis]
MSPLRLDDISDDLLVPADRVEGRTCPLFEPNSGSPLQPTDLSCRSSQVAHFVESLETARFFRSPKQRLPPNPSFPSAALLATAATLGHRLSASPNMSTQLLVSRTNSDLGHMPVG